MGCRIWIEKADDDKTFNVWLKSNGNKYKIGNGFSFIQDEHAAWKLALQLATQLENDLLKIADKHE